MSIQRLVVASAVSLFAAGTALSAESAKAPNSVEAGHCEARVVKAQTHFPKAAQDRGEDGVVRIQVVLNAEGRVVSSKITDSSASRTLDAAAEKSVSQEWRFDVSHCIADALPTTQEVHVVYRRVPKSISVGVDRRGLARVRQASTDSACSVVPSESGSHVISCIQPKSADGLAATR